VQAHTESFKRQSAGVGGFALVFGFRFKEIDALDTLAQALQQAADDEPCMGRTEAEVGTKAKGHMRVW
jgi:hypothetical protein